MSLPGEHEFDTVASRDVYSGAIVALRVDRVAMPGGREADREVGGRPPGGGARRGPNGSVLGGHRRVAGAFDELHVEAQGLELLEQHVEAFGQARF